MGMKKTIIVFLAVVLLVVLCACNDKENGTETSTDKLVEGKTNTETSDQHVEDETPLNVRYYKGIEVPEYITDAQLAELDAVDKYLDNEQYLLGNGPKLDNIIDEVNASGVCLKIGMSYEEVLATGLVPTEEDFADTVTGLLAYTCLFVDAEGNHLRLGFWGEQDKTVADSVLYSVSLEDNMDFNVGPCKVPCTVSEVLEKLGEPYDLGFGVWSDILDIRLEYWFQSCDLYLRFNVNLETGEVFDFTLEGYAN